MSFDSLKVALVGPCEGGKTRIANHLAHEPPREGGQYDPTKGVRILSCEREIEVDGRKVRLPVELWDVSGNEAYKKGWPAVAAALDAAVVVFDPTSKAQASTVKQYGKAFASLAALGNGQIAVFAHGHLTSQHRPISLAVGGAEQTVRVETPIYNVNLDAPADGDAAASRTLADAAFDEVLAHAYAAREAEDAEAE